MGGCRRDLPSLALLGGRRSRGLTFDTDVLSLLPRDGRVIPAFRTFVEHFGSLDELYVVFTAPEGHAIADYDDEIEAWVDALRAAPEITRVDTGIVDRSRDLGWLADRQLLLLRTTHARVGAATGSGATSMRAGGGRRGATC